MAQQSYLASLLVVLGLGALLLGLLYCLVQISKSWKLALIDRVLRALKRRRNSKDTFRSDFGYSWDYFMVFKVYDEDDVVTDLQREFSFQYILDRLTAGGLEIRLFYSLQRKEVFCKIRCPLSRLQKHADLIDFKMLLDREALKTICATGREGLWEPIKLQEYAESSELTSLSAFEYIYAKYEFDTDNDLTADHLFPLYKRWPRLTVEKLSEERNQVANSMFGNVASSNRDINTNNLLRVTGGGAGNDSPSTRNPMTGGALSPSTKGLDGEVKEGEEDGGHRERILEESSLFKGVDRLKLIHAIICYHGLGGCALDPYQLIKDECILAYGPLHDMVELRELEGEWLTLLSYPWDQPFEKIKNYFGEKIGLYFLWLGVYTSWLFPAAIVGFGVWVNIAADGNNPNAASIPYFCGFMGLWSALFLENWKRTEKTTAMKWGMVGFEEEEQPRPQFKGEPTVSPVTGKPELYLNPTERAARVQFSQSVICVLIVLVITIIAAIFGLRAVMSNANFQVAGVQMASIVASILISIQIQVLNGIFGEIALKLNNQENHRTDTEYEDALIGKVFLFQFVNSFASLFYIAFIKPFIPGIDPCTISCMLELQTTLATIFLTRLALGNLTELGIPMVKTFFENRKRKQAMLKVAFQSQSVTNPSGAASQLQAQNGGTRSTEGLELSSNCHETIADSGTLLDQPVADDGKFELSEIEKTFLMEEYHVMLGTFDDYAEMVIQFGYTTMFVAGFPLATVMSLVNNYVEIRIDAYKLCHVCRRPEPRSQEDIGTWQGILEVISYSSIFVNSAIVAYTTTIAIDYTWVERAWIFILMASGLFMIRLMVAYLIPDEPVEVGIQSARQEYLVRKVALNVEDEDDSDLGKNNFITPNYLVLQTDDDPL